MDTPSTTDEACRRWDERYTTGDLPWDSGRVDPSLTEFIGCDDVSTASCLELACGTGTNAVWLAMQGARVTALDISPVAVDRARERASAAGVDLTLMVGDALRIDLPRGGFTLIFDRGGFHSVGSRDDQALLAERIHGWLSPGGYWVSMMGNADTPPREVGPPTLTAREITQLIEPWFEIRCLRAGHFDSKQDSPAPAWLCAFRRRDIDR